MRLGGHGEVVGHGEVGFSIAVEVTHGYRNGIGSCAVADRGLEGAIALAQQYRDVGGADRRQVWLAVAVEVTHRDRYGPSSRVRRASRREAGLGTTVGQGGI